MKHSQRQAIDGYRHAARELAELFAGYDLLDLAGDVLSLARRVTHVHDGLRGIEGEKTPKRRKSMTLEPKT